VIVVSTIIDEVKVHNMEDKNEPTYIGTVDMAILY
jgi:hypothetical protein